MVGGAANDHSTRVTRSRSSTLFGVIAGPVVAAIGWGIAHGTEWLADTIYGPGGMHNTLTNPGAGYFLFVWYVALIVGAIMGVGLVWFGLFGAFEAPCPLCGALLDNLSGADNDPTLCLKCKGYCEGRGRELHATPLDRISERRVFTAPLSAGAVFPDVCCVCGGPSARTVDVGSVSKGKKQFARVEVPHCAAHDDGASVTDDSRISFRSRVYLRRYCHANATEPTAI